jgi:ADP-ribosylglycohydrolase
VTDSRLARARLSLEGLSVGDAFGERFFGSPAIVTSRIEQRLLPAGPWFWTDDTAMALSIFEELESNQRIDRDSLATRFARRYRQDHRRGYGGTAHDILKAISLGEPWQEVAQSAFEGQGSMGNGGSMRSAPIGAYFADDRQAVVSHARASAEPTHAHPEGQAGAIAVAVAAALATQVADGETLLRETLALTTVSALGDRDTTCAITGSIVALTAPIPTHFLDSREPLDSTLNYLDRDAIATRLGRH